MMAHVGKCLDRKGSTGAPGSKKERRRGGDRGS